RRDPAGGVQDTHYGRDGGLIGQTGAGAATPIVVVQGDGGVQVTRPGGGTARLRYDAQGQLLALQESDGRTWQWDYDTEGNRVRQVLPSGAATTFRYDRGFVCEQMDAAG